MESNKEIMQQIDDTIIKRFVLKFVYPQMQVNGVNEWKFIKVIFNKGRNHTKLNKEMIALYNELHEQLKKVENTYDNDSEKEVYRKA